MKTGVRVHHWVFNTFLEAFFIQIPPLNTVLRLLLYIDAHFISAILICWLQISEECVVEVETGVE